METKRRTIAKLILRLPGLITEGNMKKGIFYLKIYGFRAFLSKLKEKIGKEYSNSNLYHLWIEKNEPKEDELEIQRNIRFVYEPKISIIVPTYNTPKQVLISMLESILNQTYSNWELCIADGKSKKPHIKEKLEYYAKKDKRIKIKFLIENKGIAGNSNEALSLATGDFIALLDHDDELAPFALYEVIKLLNKHPNVDFIYSDRDKITSDGKRVEPFFKPDWAPDYFLSCNHLCHLTVIQKSIMDKIGGFRIGYDGSQDYDLFLRVTECTQKIAHIPKILYHWRMTEQSAAINLEAKPYAYEAAKRALSDAMRRRGFNAHVINGPTRGTYRIKYISNESKKVSIIISTKDNTNILKKCIESIIGKTSYTNYEILIVDNLSKEAKTFKYYQKIKGNGKVRIITYDKPFNFSAINNYASFQCNGNFLLFLNNDTEVISPEWLEAMMEFAQRKDVGAVGAKLFYPNNTIQHAGIILGITGIAGHPHRHLPRHSPGYGEGMKLVTVQNFSAVTGACMMMRREVFDEVGGFDERYSHAFNDIDLCIRIREKGYLIVFTPYAELYHHESLSRGYENTPEKQMRFKKEIELFKEKWGHILAKGDPYYNSNLTLDKEDFSIRI